VIAQPPVVLWPNLAAAEEVPPDVREQLIEQLARDGATQASVRSLSDHAVACTLPCAALAVELGISTALIPCDCGAMPVLHTLYHRGSPSFHRSIQADSDG